MFDREITCLYVVLNNMVISHIPRSRRFRSSYMHIYDEAGRRCILVTNMAQVLAQFIDQKTLIFNTHIEYHNILDSTVLNRAEISLCQLNNLHVHNTCNLLSINTAYVPLFEAPHADYRVWRHHYTHQRGKEPLRIVGNKIN